MKKMICQNTTLHNTWMNSSWFSDKSLTITVFLYSVYLSGQNTSQKNLQI